MKPQVVYISGSGRSGSTMLERMFHSAPGVFALGEFHCLWRLPAEDITCACGEPFADDPFWREACARAGWTAETAAELRRLEARVCRTGFLARHGFSLARLGRHPAVARFLDLQQRLFAAIAQEAGAHTLVDSSKAGPRAWLLACDPTVAVAHIYRDPEDVIVSWRSQKFDPGLGTAMARPSIPAAAVDWLKAERLARWLGARRPVSRVDYAALCADPQGRFARLCAELALPHPVQPAWTAPDSFAQGPCYHSLNGNPDRFDRGPVQVSLRRPRWSAVPEGEQRTARAAARLLHALAPRRAD